MTRPKTHEVRSLAPHANRRGHPVLFKSFFVTSLLVILSSGIASADAIVVTKAMTASTVVEISIEKSEVRIELAIGAPDLLAFQNLLPDEMRTQMELEARPLDQRLEEFFHHDFVIRVTRDQPQAEKKAKPLGPAGSWI